MYAQVDSLIGVLDGGRERERERENWLSYRNGKDARVVETFEDTCGERAHAYASCMPWGNNSYEVVSPVNRDVHGTESRMPLRFASFTRF